MKSFVLMIALAGIIFPLSAQEKIEVKVEEKEMSQGMQTAFMVTIPESDIDFVEKQWKKYANDRPFFENVTKGAAGRLVENTYKSVANTVSPDKERELNKQKLRIEKENNEFIVRKIIHKHVTQDLLDIYARITQMDSGTQVSAFFRFSDSVFINETNVDEETLISIKNYIYEFGVETYRGVVENQIKDAERELRRMNVVLSNMESKNESFNKTITRSEAEIDKCESDIDLNNGQLKRVIEKIDETRKQMLKHKKKSIQYESLKDLLKERNKEKKKIEKQNKKLKTKIKRMKLKIKDSNSDIINNNLGQKQQQADIANQEQVISDLETKLNNIK